MITGRNAVAMLKCASALILTWQVGEDDEAEVIVVVEGDVGRVGQCYGVQAGLQHVRQGKVDGHHFTLGNTSQQ